MLFYLLLTFLTPVSYACQKGWDIQYFLNYITWGKYCNSRVQEIEGKWFFFPVLRDLACLEIEGEKLGLEMVSKTEYLD